MGDRAQESRGRAAAPAPSDSQLITADTQRSGAIEIGIARKSELHTRIYPGRGSPVTGSQVGDFEFAEAAMILALAALVALVAPEVRQQLAITPAFSAEPLPVIEVLMLTANEYQAVYGGRSAEHAAARPHDRAPARGLARLGSEQARKTFVVDRPVITDRKLEPKIAVRSAGFQQQHAA